MFAQAPHPNYDVSPDGTRFLMMKRAEQPQLFAVWILTSMHRRNIMIS